MSQLKKMKNFRKGDFVSLKEPNFICLENFNGFYIQRFSRDKVKILEITNIESDSVELKFCNKKVPLSDIKEIKINGKDDLRIYYDPIIMAPIIGINDPVPEHKSDYTYYYDSFKRCKDGNKNFQELIQEKGFKYVHEVQHFLFDKYQDEGLKIKY
jgi:hypothetical protein